MGTADMVTKEYMRENARTTKQKTDQNRQKSICGKMPYLQMRLII